MDTSAAVAVIFGEEGSGDLVGPLEGALVRLMSAATRVELGIVVEARLWPAGQDVADRLVRDARIVVAPVDGEQASRAMSA